MKHLILLHNIVDNQYIIKIMSVINWCKNKIILNLTSHFNILWKKRKILVFMLLFLVKHKQTKKKTKVLDLFWSDESEHIIWEKHGCCGPWARERERESLTLANFGLKYWVVWLVVGLCFNWLFLEAPILFLTSCVPSTE